MKLRFLGQAVLQVAGLFYAAILEIQRNLTFIFRYKTRPTFILVLGYRFILAIYKKEYMKNMPWLMNVHGQRCFCQRF